MSSHKPSGLISEKELRQIQEHFGLPTLDVFLREDWGSQNPEHRLLIRQHAMAIFEKEVLKTQESFSNLGVVPTLNSISLSITHCSKLGGYAFVAKPWQIGFDIEETRRLNEKVVRRVCEDPIELEQAPSPAHLWVAKEASFKALLGDHQPTVISDIEVSQWKPMDLFDDEAYSFCAIPDGRSLSLMGISFGRSGFQIGIALFSKASG